MHTIIKIAVVSVLVGCGNSISVSNPTTESFGFIQDWTDREICDKAIGLGGQWTNDPDLLEFVYEAKERGLRNSLDCFNPQTKIVSKSLKNTQQQKPNVTSDNIKNEQNNKSFDNQCNSLQSKIDNHINLSEYDKASSAINLMKQMGCDKANETNASSNVKKKEVIIKNNDSEIRALQRQLNQLQEEKNLILSQIENEKSMKKRRYNQCYSLMLHCSVLL